MLYALMLANCALVIWFGMVTLRRFPPRAAPRAYAYANGNYHLRIRSNAIREIGFRIGFVAYWEVGTTFEIHGEIVSCHDGLTEVDLKNAKSVRIIVIPYGEWFDDQWIGRDDGVTDGRLDGVLHLPFQISAQFLEEFRKEPQRQIWLQGRTANDGSGRTRFHLMTMS